MEWGFGVLTLILLENQLEILLFKNPKTPKPQKPQNPKTPNALNLKLNITEID
jgi:hypothetical protein